MLGSMQHFFLIERDAAACSHLSKTKRPICYRPVKRMRCLINISSAAFLSEMCPLTLLLTLTNVSSRCSSVPRFHLRNQVGMERCGRGLEFDFFLIAGIKQTKQICHGQRYFWGIRGEKLPKMIYF